jgi:hypothetical protein
VLCDAFTDHVLYYQRLVNANEFKSMMVVRRRMFALLQQLDALLNSNVNYQLEPVLKVGCVAGRLLINDSRCVLVIVLLAV